MNKLAASSLFIYHDYLGWYVIPTIHDLVSEISRTLVHGKVDTTYLVKIVSTHMAARK